MQDRCQPQCRKHLASSHVPVKAKETRPSAATTLQHWRCATGPGRPRTPHVQASAPRPALPPVNLSAAKRSVLLLQRLGGKLISRCRPTRSRQRATSTTSRPTAKGPSQVSPTLEPASALQRERIS